MSEEQNSQFTLSIVTGADANGLVRLTMAIARHRIEIMSLTSIADEAAGSSRHVLLVRATRERVRRAKKQIGATLGVLSANHYAEGETIDREVALYKLTAVGLDEGEGSRRLGELVRSRRARVLVRGRDSIVVEKTGSRREIEDLYESLRPFGVTEFVRSGRVMVTGSKTGAAPARSGNSANGG
jgi:acetolactate synthase-1/3 small subunit